MALFHKRPLALGFLFFILSVASVILGDAGTEVPIVSFLVFSVCIIVAFVRGKKTAIPILILLFALLCAGFFRSYLHINHIDQLKEENLATTANTELTINEVHTCTSFFSSYEATVTKINGNKALVDVIFSVPYQDSLEPGTKISASVTFSDFSENNDGFNEKLYYNSKGIYLTANETENTKYKIITEHSNTNRPMTLASQLREKFVDISESCFPEENGIPAAVFFGDRSSLSDIDKMNFRRTGTYHLLALSGMHLSVLAGILDFILRLLSVRKGKRLAAISLTVIFYVFLTGFSLSVVRAAIMLIISYLAYFSRRESDSLTSLLFAAAVICAVSPCSVADVGFILSFATTFGIVAFYPLIEKKITHARSIRFSGKAIYYILSSLGISFVALMSSLPVSWLYFGKVAVLSPIGTLLISPLISALMLLIPFTLLLGSLPIAGQFAGRITVLVAKATSQLTRILARPEKIELSLDYPFTPFFFIPFFLIILALIFLKLKNLKVFFAAAMGIMLCFFAVHTIYVQGEAMSPVFLCRGENEYFIISQAGQNTLVDISDGSYSNLLYAGKNATAKGYCRIDALVLTHYHNRHISSVSKLTKNLPVGQIILPEPITQEEAGILLSIEENAREQGIPVHVFASDNGFVLYEETQVSLDRKYITDSTHPILSLDFEGEIGISYLGSSYAAWRSVQQTRENTIFGTHGPIAKKEFSVSLPRNVRLISFADRSMTKLISKSFPRPPDSCKILLNPSMIRIK